MEKCTHNSAADRYRDSALYIGKVRHRRFMPKNHQFDYPVFMVWLNLDQIDQFLATSILWNRKKFWPASFCESDYLKEVCPDQQKTLKQKVTILVEEKLATRIDQVCLLTNFRYFGFSINPISCFYCFKDGQLQALVAEVTNTPWGEAIHYVLDCRQQPNKQRLWFDKKMHVSPFNPMEMQYHWYSNTPTEHFGLHLETSDQRGKVLDATLTLKRRVANKRKLNQIIWQFPLMTIKIAWGIYYQALKLWLKKVPLFDHQPWSYAKALSSYRQGPLRPLKRVEQPSSTAPDNGVPPNNIPISSDKADHTCATQETAEHYDRHKDACPASHPEEFSSTR